MVDRRSDAALQNHLQNLRVRRLLIRRGCQLERLLLNVLDRHLDRLEHDLAARDYLDASLHVREVVLDGQNGFALALLVQLAVRLARLRERRRIDEAL